MDYDNAVRYESWESEMNKTLAESHFKELLELKCITNVRLEKTEKGYIIKWNYI